MGEKDNASMMVMVNKTRGRGRRKWVGFIMSAILGEEVAWLWMDGGGGRGKGELFSDGELSEKWDGQRVEQGGRSRLDEFSDRGGGGVREEGKEKKRLCQRVRLLWCRIHQPTQSCQGEYPSQRQHARAHTLSPQSMTVSMSLDL